MELGIEMAIKRAFVWAILLCTIVSMSACSSDEEITQGDANDELVTEARDYLSGDIVLYTKATMNGVDKTYFDKTGGCPTKFVFNWSSTDEQTLNIALLNFTVGNMGMIINFKCDVKTMVLNSWEKKEYTGDGWVKFYGENGSCWGQNEDGSDFDGDGSASGSVVNGSFIQGYYNAKTHEIEFIVNYNMMNVRSECPSQTIDKSLADKYDELAAQYETDLKKAKEEAGVS